MKFVKVEEVKTRRFGYAVTKDDDFNIAIGKFELMEGVYEVSDHKCVATLAKLVGLYSMDISSSGRFDLNFYTPKDWSEYKSGSLTIFDEYHRPIHFECIKHAPVNATMKMFFGMGSTMHREGGIAFYSTPEMCLMRNISVNDDFIPSVGEVRYDVCE